MTNTIPRYQGDFASFDAKPDIARVRIHDLAGLLSCSVSTVRRRIQTGAVPTPMKEGGVLVWRVGDLRRALA
ncbi:helix-turn-helix transcriptional regulator [Pararobbsia silviterrae]|uniref:Transcriptional regulator n=1 Tax=Pararobbsia silviterrae TaxID=1792498 RepID=A0A494Y7E0_9BURK|nr:transcriptional regulator [Pararobbsia silviterrae]RKP58629.1 transcriptional regulator [Pararobbsia silviterrae]